MITQIGGEKALQLLSRSKRDICALKIQGLVRAYGTNYGFCRAYAGQGLVICKFYGDVIVALIGVPDEEQFDELAVFLAATGFSSVSCDGFCAKKLCKRLSLQEEKHFVMKYGGKADIMAVPDENPPLDRVFYVLESSFSLDYRDWYADMSHRIRHGVSKAYLLENSAAAAVMCEGFGMSYLSFVCTKPEARGKGLAAALLGYLGGEARKKGLSLTLICTEELLPFYRKVGFDPADSEFLLTKRTTERNI